MFRLRRRTLQAVIVSGFMAAALAVGGCAHPVAVTQSRGSELAFDEAVDTAVDALFEQTHRRVIGKRTVVIDPVLEAGSGNQTGATRLIDARIAERVAERFPGFEIAQFHPLNMAKARYVLTGTMSRIGPPVSAAGGYQIDLALADLKTRSITAQASSRALAQGVDTTPTVFYRDSPVRLHDSIVERAVTTSRTPPGQPVVPEYLESMPAGTLLAEATNAYNADRIEQALALYTQALSATGGDQIRVHNGIYLANWRLGRVDDAEQAFGRVVASNLAHRHLGVKFLFKTDSTDFWPEVSSAYAFWLRQIAKQAATSKACLHVVGHASRTGSEQHNDQLSQRRAEYIKQRLESESAELATRTRASGMGFRENLIGTGTDDMRDALDRRVEFKIDECRDASAVSAIAAR